MILEPKHKRFILLLVILAIVAGVATFVYNKRLEQTTDNAPAQVDLGKIPDFAMGSVTKVEGNNVYITGAFQNDSKKEILAVVTEKTKITKQGEIRGLESTSVVGLNEIKPGQTIVVYYSNKTDSGFDVDSIQIVN